MRGRSAPISDRSSGRLTLLVVLMAALLLALVGRAIQVMVLDGGELAQAAQSNDTRVVLTPAARGLIVDRQGIPLAGNQSSLEVRLDPARLPQSDAERQSVLAAVARELDMTPETVTAKLLPCGSPGAAERPVCNEGNPSEPAVVAANLTAESVSRIAEMPEAFPGVTVASRTQRSYPQKSLQASHILGYLSRVTAEEFAARPDGSALDLVGRSGLEERYETDLAGSPGRRVVRVDAAGRMIDENVETTPTPGSTVVTSIDAQVQAAAESALRDVIGGSGRAGAAVVVDVQTGRTVALASYPDYDPEIWTGGISETDYQDLLKSKALINNPTQGLFPPGSTFKPITVLAMERAGMNLNQAVRCPASYQAAGLSFRNHDSEAFGTISLAQALEVSCNTVFYRVGDQLWQRGGSDRIAADELDPIAQAATDLGLGSVTGIDLPAEADGLVASPSAKNSLWENRHEAWCAAAEAGYPELRQTDPKRAKYFTELDAENCANGARWRQGDAINAAIGQGLTSISPMQLVMAYAAIAGDGRLRTPTVARAIRSAEGEVRDVDPTASAEVVVPQRTRNFLKRALARVPVSGTAAGAFAGFPLTQYPIAGKTGTAQVEGKDSTAWFASFAPADDPRYAVVVTVEEGGGGGDSAAPVVRRIYESIFGVGQPPALPAGGLDFVLPAVKPVVEP